MEAIKYYYCKTCNLKVETGVWKCPQCRKNFKQKSMPTYTKEQIDEMIQNRMRELEEAASNVGFTKKESEDMISNTALTQESEDVISDSASAQESVQNNSNDITEQNTEKKAEQTVKKVLEMAEGLRVCPQCKKRYDIDVSECPDCDMPLGIYYEEAEPITNEPVAGEVEDVLGIHVDNPEWKISVTRFVNGISETSEKEILLSRNIFSMGRAYVMKNQLFSGTSKEVFESIKKASAYNALLLQKDGKLYIQYDWLIHTGYQKNLMPKPPTRKASIYINGDKLPMNSRYQLAADDKVLLGDGAINNSARCLELVIKRTSQPEEIAKSAGNAIHVADTKQDLTDLKRMLEEQNRKIEEMAGDVKGVAADVNDVVTGVEEVKTTVEENYNATKVAVDNTSAIMESLSKLEGMQRDRFDNVNTFIESLETTVLKFQVEDKRTKEEYIDLFLKKNPEKKELLSCLNDAQKKYLVSAASVEIAMDECGLENKDYSGAYIFIGKLLENYLYNVVNPMLYKCYGKDWYKTPEEQGFKNVAKLMLGNYTKVLEYRGSDFYENIAKRLKDKLNENEACKINAEDIGEKFAMFNMVREARNGSAHGSSKAISENDVKSMTREEYYQAKAYVFSDNILGEILSYAQIIVRKNINKEKQNNSNNSNNSKNNSKKK